METPEGPAAPESGHTDPELESLLQFDPVPRQVKVEGGWTPELQREFIARLAEHGSPTRACEELGKNRTGINKLYRSPHGASFRSAWHDAVELAKRRKQETAALDFVRPGTRAPMVDLRRKAPLPGQRINEQGECEDEESLARRGEEAGRNICRKLLGIRRLYLEEISSSPGKRAAFEILTELPIDWDKAARGEPQADEPYTVPNMREPDMVLTAESGWLMGEHGYGPERKAEARRAMDDHRAAQGLEPIDWGADD
jgi:hypothetical protein